MICRGCDSSLENWDASQNTSPLGPTLCTPKNICLIQYQVVLMTNALSVWDYCTDMVKGTDIKAELYNIYGWITYQDCYKLHSFKSVWSKVDRLHFLSMLRAMS